MSKSDCDDQEWSVIDDAESPINPAASPSCIDSDFEDLANPQIEGDQSAECVEEKSSAEPVQFALPLSVAAQQSIAIVAEVKQDSVQVEITSPSDTQSPCSVPSVSIHTESVAVCPQLQTAEEPHNMSGSDMPSSPESSVLDPSPCSPSMNAVLEFPSSAPQSESEPEDDEKHFDLHEQADQEETGEVEESSFLTLQCPMCSRHSTSEKQCSFCCFQLQWDCPRCTYLNSFADDACLMCSLGAEPNQPSTQHTATLTNTHTRTPICEPTHAEADDVDESAEFDDVSFYKDSDRRRCATDASVKRQKDRVAVKVSIPLQFNLLNQPARVLNEEAARKREVQAVQEFNVEDVVRIRSMLRFKASNAAASSAKRDPAARTSDNTDLNCDEEYSEHVRSVVSRRNAKFRAAKSKRSQAKLNSHDKRKARSDVRKSLSQAFDWEDLGTFRQQCADRHATELLSGTLASRAYWRSNEDVMELKSIRTIPLPDNLIDRFFEKCKSVSGKKSKYVLSLCMQRISLVHPSLRERLSLLDTENAYCLVVFAVISHPGCFYYPPADHELPLFEVSYTYRYTEKAAVPSVTSDQIANRTTLAQLHKMADRLRSKAFFEADLVRHSQEAPLSVE